MALHSNDTFSRDASAIFNIVTKRITLGFSYSYKYPALTVLYFSSLNGISTTWRNSRPPGKPHHLFRPNSHLEVPRSIVLKYFTTRSITRIRRTLRSLYRLGCERRPSAIVRQTDGRNQLFLVQ